MEFEDTVWFFPDDVFEKQLMEIYVDPEYSEKSN